MHRPGWEGRSPPSGPRAYRAHAAAQEPSRPDPSSRDYRQRSPPRSPHRSTHNSGQRHASADNRLEEIAELRRKQEKLAKDFDELSKKLATQETVLQTEAATTRSSIEKELAKWSKMEEVKANAFRQGLDGNVRSIVGKELSSGRYTQGVQKIVDEVLDRRFVLFKASWLEELNVIRQGAWQEGYDAGCQEQFHVPQPQQQMLLQPQPPFQQLLPQPQFGIAPQMQHHPPMRPAMTAPRPALYPAPPPPPPPPAPLNGDKDKSTSVKRPSDPNAPVVYGLLEHVEQKVFAAIKRVDAHAMQYVTKHASRLDAVEKHVNMPTRGDPATKSNEASPAREFSVGSEVVLHPSSSSTHTAHDPRKKHKRIREERDSGSASPASTRDASMSASLAAHHLQMAECNKSIATLKETVDGLAQGFAALSAEISAESEAASSSDTAFIRNFTFDRMVKDLKGLIRAVQQEVVRTEGSILGEVAKGDERAKKERQEELQDLSEKIDKRLTEAEARQASAITSEQALSLIDARLKEVGLDTLKSRLDALTNTIDSNESVVAKELSSFKSEHADDYEAIRLLVTNSEANTVSKLDEKLGRISSGPIESKLAQVATSAEAATRDVTQVENAFARLYEAHKYLTDVVEVRDNHLKSGMTKISNAVQDLQTTRTTNEEQLRAFQSLGNIVRDLMVFLWLPGSAPTPFLQHYLSLILPQAEQAAGAGQAQQMPQRGQSYTPTAARPSINMSTQPIRPGSGQERAPVTYEAAHSASATSSSLPTSRTQPRPSSSGHSAQQSQFMQQQYLPQQRSVSGSQMPQLNGTNEMRASWAAQMRPPAMPSPDSSTYLPNRTQLQSGTGPTPMEFQPPPSGSGHGPSLQSQSPQQQPLRQQQSGSPQLDPSVHALLAQSYQRILQKNRKQGE